MSTAVFNGRGGFNCEFVRAIVLAAGQGSRLSELTDRCPKALLPVGVRPLIWYPLRMLHRNGFKECIIVVSASQRNEILTQLNDMSNTIDIHWRVVEVSSSGARGSGCGVENEIDSESDDQEDRGAVRGDGTADALRQILHNDLGKTDDLLVVSCDLVTSDDVSLDALFALHYAKDSALTMLLTPLPLGRDIHAAIPGPKSKKRSSGIERDFVGLEADTRRLVFMASEADSLDDEAIEFRTHVLSKCSRLVVRSDLLDAHVYLLSRRVTSFWLNDVSANSFKGEVMPLLIERQFRCTRSVVTGTESLIGKMDYECYGHVITEPRPHLCVRVNNLATFCYANRQLSRLWPAMNQAVGVSLPSIEDGKTIGSECFVWRNVQVGNASVVEGLGTVIGQDCKIASNVRITNSIIMDNAIIKDRCTIVGCVIGRGVVIESGCHLTDCIVTNETIPPNTKLSGELIADVDGLMEIA